LTQEEINSFVKLASENGIQCVTHGIGNLGIDHILNAYETVDTDGQNPLRNGIIHVQITDLGQLRRMAENKILSIVQPIFLHYDMHIVEDRVGKDLTSTSYTFKTMKDLGLNTSYGTDSPVESFNVLNCIHCAVNRQDLKFYPDGGFYPDEKVSIVDAIEAYTAKSAYTSFEEDVKGKLLPGYYGDLVVLSDNIFTIDSKNIIDIKIDMTMVNGNVVYKR
jgi:predicted amidohydrolase YtcJ